MSRTWSNITVLFILIFQVFLLDCTDVIHFFQVPQSGVIVAPLPHPVVPIILIGVALDFLENSVPKMTIFV